MSNFTFRVTGGTNVGLVRKNNEDNFIVNPDLTQPAWFIPTDTLQSITISDFGALMIVADGMGGANAGEVASNIAIETVKEEFSNHDLSKIITSNNKIENLLYDTIVKADSNIKTRVKTHPETEGMGTTIVMSWVINNVAHVAWCGDSRAYIYNHKIGLSRLSKDHSYVQQLVDDGKLDEDLAFDHPNSNIITRSLGDSSTKARPDYVSRLLEEGDMIILCSDGLCGLCRDSEILEVLNAGSEQGYSIEQFKASLIQAALEAGGYDNVTITLMQVDSVASEPVVSQVEEELTTLNDFKAAKKRKAKGKFAYVIALLASVIALAVLAYVLYDYIPSWDTIKTKIEQILDSKDKSKGEVSPKQEGDKTEVKPQSTDASETIPATPQATKKTSPKPQAKSTKPKKETKKKVQKQEVEQQGKDAATKQATPAIVPQQKEANPTETQSEKVSEKVVEQPSTPVTEKPSSNEVAPASETKQSEATPVAQPQQSEVAPVETQQTEIVQQNPASNNTQENAVQPQVETVGQSEQTSDKKQE